MKDVMSENGDQPETKPPKGAKTWTIRPHIDQQGPQPGPQEESYKEE